MPKATTSFFDFDTWRCPNPGCQYVITDTEMQVVRYDFGCPRCKTPLANFILKLAKEMPGRE